MLNHEGGMPELYGEFTDKTQEDFLTSLWLWQEMPRAIDLEYDSIDWNRLVWMSNVESNADVNDFLTAVREERDGFLRNHRYDEALNFMVASYQRATEEYVPDSQIMAQVHVLRMTGNVYLHELLEAARGNITLSDTRKMLSTYNMCVCYMQSDLLNFNITPLTAGLLFSFLHTSPEEDIRNRVEKAHMGQKPEHLTTYHGQDMAEIIRFAPEAFEAPAGI